MSVVPSSLVQKIAVFNYHPGSYIHSDWLSDFSDSSLDYFQGSGRYYQIVSSRIIDLISGQKNICHDFSSSIRKLCLVKDIQYISFILGAYLHWFAIVSSLTSKSVKSWISILGEDDYFWIVQAEKISFISCQSYSKSIAVATKKDDVEKMKFLLYQSGARVIRRLLIEEHAGLWDRLSLKFPKDVVCSKLHDFSFYSSEVLRNILMHILVERLPEWQQLIE